MKLHEAFPNNPQKQMMIAQHRWRTMVMFDNNLFTLKYNILKLLMHANARSEKHVSSFYEGNVNIRVSAKN